MKLLVSLVAVVLLFLLGFYGVQSMQLYSVFGMVIPYAAIAVFLIGVVWKLIRWARSPVPFHITTTCGQQKSLPWIQSSYLENPHTKFGVILRMALEILLFRSLFRNTRMEAKGANIVHGSSKWLWGAGLLFHWTFLLIFLRHLRFFTEPVPLPVIWLQELDGFLQIGVPVMYLTTVLFLGAVTFLFFRRVVLPQVRYISLPSDYFPLFLIMGIGFSGAFLRHFFKTDITAAKQLALGLISLNPASAEVLSQVSPLFFAHLFLVSILFIYFPFSKLMHLGGVFLSPTRNLTGNSREVRHINPWDYPVKTHPYEAYEDEFRDRMIEAGIPVEKES